jgi:hypothetical protein
MTSVEAVANWMILPAALLSHFMYAEIMNGTVKNTCVTSNVEYDSSVECGKTMSYSKMISTILIGY